MEAFHGTTIIAIKHNGKVVMAGDGQVSMGSIAIKHGAQKVRRLYNDKILAGFAGSTADAFTLLERFSQKLESYSGRLARAAVELAKDWRTDKYLRRLEALMIVADKDSILMLSGNGDVIEPDDNVIAVGSGGPYAYAAARALMENAANLSAEEIARKAMEIAADMCVYTNSNLTLEVL